ncbi:MAG: LPS assembly protein LptD [Pseudomonadota bacterium]|nr:LPS assembly protein LptD [Pseudomonadota bacterium]
MSVQFGVKVIFVALVLVTGQMHALADDKPITFEADNAVVNKLDGSLIATGNVLLKQAGSTLAADEITYFQQTDRAVARGNVIYTDSDGTISRANFMQLGTEFTHIVAETLISQFASGEWIAAEHADRIVGDKAVFKTSRFTPCKCDFANGEKPLWDIRASQSVRNEKANTITHYNLRMHVLNLPVFYLPILSHPDWTVRRRSGFLTPSFTISSDVGFTPSISYFQVIDDTKDSQFNFYKYQYRGAALKTNYRQLWDQSAFQANIYAARVETYKAVREEVGAVDASFTSTIGDDWDINTRLVRSSQDTFLRRYKFNTETSLKSSSTAERIVSDRYYYVEASDRQSLTTANKNTNEPTILPHIFYEKVRKGWRPKQKLRTEISALQLDNDQGHDYARWSGVFEIAEDIPIRKGIGNYNASLMANYYEIHSQSSTASSKLGTVAHTNPSASLGWRMPVTVSGFGRMAIIEPKAQVTHVSGNDRTDDIPNRDAAEYRIDEANLFLAHRYQGKDYILPGTRVDAGVGTTANDQYLGNIAAFAGISRRLSGTPSAGLNVNQDDIYSDYVASLSMSPGGFIDIRWSGRMASHDFTVNESKTVAAATFDTGYLNLTHNQLSQAYFVSGEDDREELSATLGKNFGAGWSFSASQIWDLSYSKTVREKTTAAINWAGGPQDCLTLTLNYEHDPNSDRDIDAVDQVNFVLSLKQLGALSPDTIAKLAGTNDTY